ncbi:MAG: sensor histidine kinase [bacterium]
MTADVAHPPIEPLFAHNARLWLRIWVTTQAAALIIAIYATIDRTDAPGALTSWRAVRMIAIVVALIAYHVIGMLRYERILQRTSTLVVFVPVSWILILLAIQVNGTFGLLILGAILQGFIFLPFAWAAVILVVVVGALAIMSSISSPRDTPGLRLMRVGIMVATGIMIGTVLLYIHRANRETALRTRLLHQLDEAHRDLADRAKEAGVLEERQRFARDIHDTLAQAFASVIRHLEAVELALGDTASGAANTDDATSLERVMPHLRHAQAVSRTSLGEIRQLVHALRPAELTEAYLVPALARIVSHWGNSNSIRATFTPEDIPPLHPDADVIFLRATQEALSNVARHANARSVSVTIGCVDGLVLLTVEDDGRGIEQSESVNPERLGLTGMRERVRRVGGHLLIDSSAAGTSLTVALPLSAIAAEPPMPGRST